MTDQPATPYLKKNQKICTCCQLPFKYTKKWNPEVLMREAIKIYGETVKFEKDVEICRKCWDGLERPKEEEPKLEANGKTYRKDSSGFLYPT